MTRSLYFAPDEFYHLYNRGTEKRVIFGSADDYDRFTALLYLCNSEEPVRIENVFRASREQGSTLRKQALAVEKGRSLISIGAYCLMPNHFHLLVKESPDGKGISRFMQKISTAYTMYFNLKYYRTGALFQGKFKAKHAQDDAYLKYLISYIHLNPLKLIEPDWKERGIGNEKKAKEFLRKFQYSSYQDFLDVDRPEKGIIDTRSLPQYFDAPKDFEACMTEWVAQIQIAEKKQQ